MSIDLSQTPRAGKYCPRCHAMMPRAQAACTQCGHRFRTVAESAEAGDAPKQSAAPKEADLINRTMQFTLPPLPSRSVAPAPPPRAVPLPASPQSRAFLAAGGIVLLLGVGAGYLWHARAVSAAASPAGVWQTTLRGRTASSARLEFALSANGTGRLLWSEPGQSGRVPLRWRVNQDKTLSLTFTPLAGSDATSQTLAGLWSSHPWPWRRDTRPNRLIVGNLILTEKP